MNWQDFREGWLRLLATFQRRRRERDLADELEFHLAMKMNAGQSAEESNREFGGLEKWKEVCRDVGSWPFLDELRRDLGLAVRTLRKSPAFTAVAILTLTLAIGANTAVFSLMDELIWKSIPAPNAKRLTILRIQPDRVGYKFSYPLFRALEQDSVPTMRAFAFSDRTLNLRTSEGTEIVAGELVSGQYFAALGVKAELGRCIEPGDDRAGSPGGMVTVVSNHFWRTRMASRREALAQKITLNQGVFTVVGILPETFRGMSRDRAPEVFIPLQFEPLVDSPFNLFSAGYRAWWLSVGGLLNDGISLKQTNAFLATNSHQLFAAAPLGLSLGPSGHKLTDLRVIAEPGANGFSDLRVRFRKPLQVLMALVAIVLLIACLNLATLLTARAAARGREISTRFALGASRGRLMRQLLTESLLLALVGAALGLAAAPVLAHFVAVTLMPQHGPQFAPLNAKPGLTVFGFTALLAVLATVLAGTLPAVRSSSVGLSIMMREGSNSIRGAERRHGWPRLLLTVEVALSLILATGAGLLGYSLVKLHRTGLGFQPHGLIFLMPEGKQPIVGDRLMLAYKQLVEQLKSLPNVVDASISGAVPISGGYMDDEIQATGGPKYHLEENAIGPGYFKTIGTPLLAGREFRWTDATQSGRKVILNLSAARLLVPDGKILGHDVLLQGGTTNAEVVGIVADSKYSSIRAPDPPTVYSAAMQGLIPGASLNVLIRTKGPVAPLLIAARTVMKRLIPDVPLPAAVSMEQAIAESLATERTMSTLALFFGGLSLLITGIGLYGTLAYSTGQRTGEIGIRMALGAERRHVISMVCAENGVITLLGCVAGIAGSVVASKTIAGLLYGVSMRNPLILGLAVSMLLCVATAASLIPAIKASRIDPASAIRHD